MPPIAFTDADKGAAVRIVHGKYAGRKGWKHKGRDETERQVHIILQSRVTNGRTEPSKVVRIAKENCERFERAITREQRILEQKPRLQKKVSALIKELVDLDFAPNEDMLVLIGHQWLQLWKKKQERINVDYDRSESPPPDAAPAVIEVNDEDEDESINY